MHIHVCVQLFVEGDVINCIVVMDAHPLTFHVPKFYHPAWKMCSVFIEVTCGRELQFPPSMHVTMPI